MNGISYPHSSDLDVLLVGPQGQSIVLLNNVGPSTGTQNASNVTVTFSDAAGSAIPQTTALGAPNSSVTTKPVDYPGTDTDTFPSPAPSGPYGTPAPKGSATLGGTFDTTNPNGTWSLYVVTVGEGDGTGSVAGGWGIDFAIANQTVSFSSTAPTSADAGTTYQASASASSTLPVTYSIDASSTPGACSVGSTGLVSFLAAGTCILDANQSGDGNYNAAPQAQQTINVVGVPGPPTSVNATPSAGQVSVTWLPPTSDGGSPVTSYNVYEGTTSGGETFLANTSSTSYLATGLTNGTKYYFEVTAVNAVGEGTRSAEVSATPITLPGAPVSLSATPQNTQVNLIWLPPSSNGGSTITLYKVYEGTTSGGETFLASTSGTSYMATGLTNGTKYYFEVTAVNGVGEGLLGRDIGHAGHVPGRPDGPGRHPRQHPGQPELDGPGQQRWLGRHLLQGLRGDHVGGRDVPGQLLYHLLPGHRADQWHQVLLRGHGRERGRGGSPLDRGLGHPGHLRRCPHRAHGYAGQRPGQLELDGPGQRRGVGRYLVQHLRGHHVGG